MCTALDRYTEGKVFTGYKVALKHKETGKYYSPSTGVEYGPDLTMPRIRKKVKDFTVYVGLLNPFRNYYLYEEVMQGKTGVFVQQRHARLLLASVRKRLSRSDYDAVLLRMKIKGDLWHALFNAQQPVVVGSTIKSIKELQL